MCNVQFVFFCSFDELAETLISQRQRGRLSKNKNKNCKKNESHADPELILNWKNHIQFNFFDKTMKRVALSLSINARSCSCFAIFNNAGNSLITVINYVRYTSLTQAIGALEIEGGLS